MVGGHTSVSARIKKGIQGDDGKKTNKQNANKQQAGGRRAAGTLGEPEAGALAHCGLCIAFLQKFFFEATDECSSPALPHSVQPVATGSAACSSRERRAGDAGSSRHFTAWPGCYHHDRVAGRKAFRALTVRLTGDKRCSLVV